MKRSNQEIAQELIDCCGGIYNIVGNSTCMTRLHLKFKDNTIVDIKRIKKIDECLSVIDGDTLQIVLGPGKVTSVGVAFSSITNIPLGSELSQDASSKVATNFNTLNESNTLGYVQKFFKHFANIFLPILPGIAAAGLINGLTKAFNVYTNNQYVEVWWYSLIMSIGWALFMYLPIFVGSNATKEFQGTPILGGIGGALSIVSESMPLLSTEGNAIILPLTNDIYNPSYGGILSALLTGVLIAYIEKFIRRHVPNVIDMFVTPLLTLIIASLISVLLLQPIGTATTTSLFTVTDFIFNKMGLVGGFVLATIQLPLVSLGLHRVFLPIHTLLNNPYGSTQGINYLLPILMIAGGGQVGSAIALYVRTKNCTLKKSILLSLPAGVLGVGEPLLYTVTLPLMKPFLMACIGSGIGGSVVSLMKVGAISQGVSGVLGVMIMNPGSTITYLIGLVIAYICGFILTYLFGYCEDTINRVFS